MYFNIELDENRQLATPGCRLTGDPPYGVTVISFRCKIEEKFTDDEILVLRTNLIDSTGINPDRVVSYITGRKKTNFVSFVPPVPIMYKMNTTDLSDGVFELFKLGSNEELEMISGAITVRIRCK